MREATEDAFVNGLGILLRTLCLPIVEALTTMMLDDLSESLHFTQLRDADWGMLELLGEEVYSFENLR